MDAPISFFADAQANLDMHCPQLPGALFFFSCTLTLTAPITTAADDSHETSFLIFSKKADQPCWQTILMKYHVLFVIFEIAKLLQIIGYDSRANSLHAG